MTPCCQRRVRNKAQACCRLHIYPRSWSAFEEIRSGASAFWVSSRTIHPRATYLLRPPCIRECGKGDRNQGLALCPCRVRNHPVITVDLSQVATCDCLSSTTSRQVIGDELRRDVVGKVTCYAHTHAMSDPDGPRPPTSPNSHEQRDLGQRPLHLRLPMSTFTLNSDIGDDGWMHDDAWANSRNDDAAEITGTAAIVLVRRRAFSTDARTLKGIKSSTSRAR